MYKDNYILVSMLQYQRKLMYVYCIYNLEDESNITSKAHSFKKELRFASDLRGK